MFHYLQTLGSDASDQDVKKLQAMYYELAAMWTARQAGESIR